MDIALDPVRTNPTRLSPWCRCTAVRRYAAAGRYDQSVERAHTSATMLAAIVKESSAHATRKTPRWTPRSVEGAGSQHDERPLGDQRCEPQRVLPGRYVRG